MSPPDNALDLTADSPNRRPQAPFRNAKTWTRADFTPQDWTVPVSSAVCDELHAIAGQLTQQTLPLFMLNPDQFDMTATRAMMAQARSMADEGPGVAVVDRLPLDDWDEDQTRAIDWLLACLLCRPVAQTLKGTIFRDIRDAPDAERGTDSAMSQKRLTYHNDNSGNRLLPKFTSLLCLYPSAEGGESEYCSSYTLYNALAEEAPELLERLFQPFYHDRRGLQGNGQPTVSWVPCFAYDGNRLWARFSQMKIKVGYEQAGQDIDNITRATLEAVQSIIPQQELSLRYMMERGQLQIINNREGLHYRADFKDGETPEQRRHLWRLWHRDEGRPTYDG